MPFDNLGDGQVEAQFPSSALHIFTGVIVYSDVYSCVLTLRILKVLPGLLEGNL